MTRDEAIAVIHKAHHPDDMLAEVGVYRFNANRRWAAKAVDGYVALGMLKLDEPIDPETRAGNILERYVGATYVASILTEFMGAGLAIVDRGAKIDTSSGE